MKATTIYFLISGIVLATVHALALRFFLYWHFPWFDMAMHLLGGTVIGLLLYVLSDLRTPMVPQRPRWFTVLIFVMIFAVGWELYEIFIGIPILDDYRADTLTDLLFGGLGAMVAYVVGNKTRSVAL